ncbi:NAD(+) diphosphatase [Sulfurospirillum arcachonense]|uniref:NAD(+) diphosphatase n=1 Tax=Sulfurospirillum arcachonense TaxID=57666 RepID=UPI00046A2925|nr:NAD(+) diphosphatase [Sulfurospirillum arcachonense]
MKNLYPFFSQNPLDRLDATRRDKKEVQKLQNLPSSKFLLFFEGNLLTQNKQYLFTQQDLLTCTYNKEEIILLGEDKNVHYFCLHVNTFPSNLATAGLREFALYVKEKSLGILAQASSVLNWHSSHKHCAECGANTLMEHAGWRRDCVACKKEHFPRVDPVVIMLVTHGEYCLLGRGVNFKENRYSCLAGYMESGESIEEAAKRELFEEAGITGGEVTYIASQPWPFPSTLMIGVHVKAKTKEITIDPHEIEDAKWVHKDDIKQILDGDESFGISTPRKIAIARNLLEYWIK